MKQFKEITIGSRFVTAGAIWTKKSSRTASLYGYVNHSGITKDTENPWFYFSRTDGVNQTYDVRRANQFESNLIDA
jgi:hypothetical protein